MYKSEFTSLYGTLSTLNLRHLPAKGKAKKCAPNTQLFVLCRVGRNNITVPPRCTNFRTTYYLIYPSDKIILIYYRSFKKMCLYSKTEQSERKNLNRAHPLTNSVHDTHCSWQPHKIYIYTLIHTHTHPSSLDTCWVFECSRRHSKLQAKGKGTVSRAAA